MRVWALLVVVLGGIVESSDASFVNVKVERTIDLTTQFVKLKAEVDIEPTESGGSKIYQIALPRGLASHLSYGEVKAGKNVAVIGEGANEGEEGFTIYNATFENPISEPTTISIYFVLTHAQTPLPKEIRQDERQFMVYAGDSHYYSSVYKTQSEATSVLLPSSNVESISKQSPTEHQGSKVSYGPYTEVEPFSYSPMRLHYESTIPFATLANVEREIEISEWGNVAFEEHCDLRHDGAKLVGGFSRLDYQNLKGKPTPSFRKITALFPLGAKELYYRDIIGNISTSQVIPGKKGLTVELQPRFPIFGGWKTEWYHGFNLALENVVSLTSDGNRKLEVPLSVLVQDVTVDYLITKVVLPAGAKLVDFKTPFPPLRTSMSTRHTFLDFPGFSRTVLSLEFENFVPEHNQPFTVTYQFSTAKLLYKPIAMATFFFLCYLVYIIAIRLDLSLEKPTAVPESKKKN